MRLLASAMLLALSALPAAADPNDFDRIVSFGDSLSDNGNLAHNIPDNGDAPFATGYFNGRFSNGPTWIELLSDPSKSSNPAESSMNRFWGGFLFSQPFNVTGNVNAAIGGAESVPNNPGPDFPRSVQTQIDTFLKNGGVFGPNDLVSVQGGANDFFGFFKLNPAASQTQVQNFATQTGLFEASNVAAVIGAGAKTVLVSNLPNFGATPNFNGNALQAQAGLFASSVYNLALNTATQALAAANPGVNLVQMDWFAALNVVIANPAAFGFTDVTHACFDNAQCTDASKFLFWDGVHPTAAGHELLAEYAALLLSTDETGKAAGILGQVSLATRLEASDIIFRRAVSPGHQAPGGLYAEIIGQTGSFDGTDSVLGSTGADVNLAGVRGGFDANEGPVTYGMSLAYQTGNVGGPLLKSDLRSTQADAYALTRYGALFAGVEAGLSVNEYDSIDRQTGFPSVKAHGNTESIDYSAAATVGADFHLQGITLTPAVRVGYASVNIDNYTEAADILGLEYGDHDVTTGFWTARLRASSPFFGYSHAIVYGEVGYEDLFATDDSYTAKLAFNTAHAVTIDDSVDARGLFLKAGISGYLDDNIKISGEYGLSLQNGDGEVHSGRLRLTVPLYAGAPMGD